MRARRPELIRQLATRRNKVIKAVMLSIRLLSLRSREGRGLY